MQVTARGRKFERGQVVVLTIGGRNFYFGADIDTVVAVVGTIEEKKILLIILKADILVPLPLNISCKALVSILCLDL